MVICEVVLCQGTRTAIQNMNSEYNLIAGTLYHNVCTDVMWVGCVKWHREYNMT